MNIRRWLMGSVRVNVCALMSAVLLCAAVPLTVRAASAPGISSLSAAVYEPQTGAFLYEKDSATARPMASTTKLMTALLAVGELDASATVRVPAAALPVEGTQVGLAAGDEVTVRDLLAALLLSSGNDAANALALLTDDTYEDFAARMNRRATELGMEDSHFVTPSGLDADGHAASARDMARLGASVLEHPLLAELCASQTFPVTVGGRRMTLTNHNKLLRLYGDCIGMKTGFTKKSGRCLVSAARRDGVTLIVATLNGGDYWNDHMALYEYGFSLVHSERMPDAAPDGCAVAGGTAVWVPLTAEEPPQRVLLNGEKIRTAVELPRFVWAPVAAGEVLGRVRYYTDTREVASVDLRAGADVDERLLPTRGERWRRHMSQLMGALLG